MTITMAINNFIACDFQKGISQFSLSGLRLHLPFQLDRSTSSRSLSYASAVDRPICLVSYTLTPESSAHYAS